MSTDGKNGKTNCGGWTLAYQGHSFFYGQKTGRKDELCNQHNAAVRIRHLKGGQFLIVVSPPNRKRVPLGDTFIPAQVADTRLDNGKKGTYVVRSVSGTFQDTQVVVRVPPKTRIVITKTA